MNTGEAYICLADNGRDRAKPERVVSSQAHSFTPLLSTFAGDRWRKSSEGIFTQVWTTGENPPGEAGFKIRLSVHPAIADDALRTVVPIVVGAGCPFKVIANTALLELAFAKWSSEESAGDFLTVYPPTQALFNDLTAKLQHAIRGVKSSQVPTPVAETGGRTALARDNPWPGLDYYLPEESAYFFGRQEEQLELGQRLERATLTVVLGQPGAGKSSLLRAGLKPLFDRMSFEPVYLRLNCAGAVQPVQQVRDEINRVLTERGIDGAPFGEGQTLRDYFQPPQAGWLDANRKVVVPVLIFDQFEELFTSDGDDPAARKPVEALWTQIANLVENRGRETIRQLHLPSPEFRTERNSFKVVISLRQDHFQELLARRGQMPSITQSQFLLKPFTGSKAVQAVLGPARGILDPANADALAEEIVRRVARETAQSSERSGATQGANEPLENLRVEPALMSFFCQRLNAARKRSREGEPGAGLITAKLIDTEAERIFASFFHREDIAATPPPAAEPPITERKEPQEPEEEELPEQKSETPAAVLATQPPIIDQKVFREPEEEKLSRQESETPVALLVTGPQITEPTEPEQPEEKEFPEQESEAPVAVLATQPQVTEQNELHEPEAEILPERYSEPPEAPMATQPPVINQKEPQRPEEEKLAVQESTRPIETPLPTQNGEHVIRRLKYLAFVLGMLLIIFLAALIVMHLEDLQRDQTEIELEQYIANVAAARNTFKSAHRQLTLAESDLALKESNLLVLTEQAREQQRESRAAKQEYSRLAGEQTNFQSRITELNAEKAKAENRVAQWSSLLYDLTNQIANLTRQKEELEARNHALAVTNHALNATNDSHAATNTPAVFSLSLSRPANSTAADEKQAAAMATPPEKLLAPITPDADSSSRRNADVLLTHGQCLYSEGGTEYHVLEVHKVIREGAIIKTGKVSWCDLFIRRAGITVRVAPESAVRIAKLSIGSQNGVPVTDTVLELPYGRLFTVVRALVPGSTLEITDGAGRSVMEGGGLGSYMITAPRPEFGDKLSVIPLRIISQQGSSVIAPGHEYSAKDGAAFSLGPSTWEMTLIHLDELEAEADKAIAGPESPKSPKPN